MYAAYEDELRSVPITPEGQIALLSFYSHYPVIKTYQTHWFDKTILMPFENICLPVPMEYDKILTCQYGDYMTPVIAPNEHGNIAMLDLHCSYESYLPQFINQAKEKERNKRRLRMKKLWELYIC